MKTVKRAVIGGLALLGLTGMAAYRAYELKKIQKSLEDQVIEITPEKVETVSQ